MTRFPGDAGVAIEYRLPATSKRIDFMITGEDADARAKVVIVELKQWSSSRRSEKDGIVWARRGGPTGKREGPHPSYQAWSSRSWSTRRCWPSPGVPTAASRW